MTDTEAYHACLDGTVEEDGHNIFPILSNLLTRIGLLELQIEEQARKHGIHVHKPPYGHVTGQPLYPKRGE